MYGEKQKSWKISYSAVFISSSVYGTISKNLNAKTNSKSYEYAMDGEKEEGKGGAA